MDQAEGEGEGVSANPFNPPSATGLKLHLILNGGNYESYMEETVVIITVSSIWELACDSSTQELIWLALAYMHMVEMYITPWLQNSSKSPLPPNTLIIN